MKRVLRSFDKKTGTNCPSKKKNFVGEKSTSTKYSPAQIYGQYLYKILKKSDEKL
jgi:hypothetical protein